MEKSPKIDLHIHSTFSDGTKTPQEIVQIAKEKGMDLIALTDHNTFAGITEMQKYAKKYGLNVLAGIELSTTWNNEDVHVLAYYSIDTDFTQPKFDKINEFNRKFKSRKKDQLIEIIKNIANDVPISVDEFIKEMDAAANSKTINRVFLANFLVKKNIVSSVQEAFNIYLDESSNYYVQLEQTSLKDGITAIVETRAIPVIAHMVQYSFFNDNEKIHTFFNEISSVTSGLGIEMYHNDHNNDTVTKLHEYAEKHSYMFSPFFYTAGSDYHGDNKENQLGICFQPDLSENFINGYYFVSDFFIKRVLHSLGIHI